MVRHIFRLCYSILRVLNTHAHTSYHVWPKNSEVRSTFDFFVWLLHFKCAYLMCDLDQPTTVLDIQCVRKKHVQPVLHWLPRWTRTDGSHPRSLHPPVRWAQSVWNEGVLWTSSNAARLVLPPSSLVISAANQVGTCSLASRRSSALITAFRLGSAPHRCRQPHLCVCQRWSDLPAGDTKSRCVKAQDARNKMLFFGLELLKVALRVWLWAKWKGLVLLAGHLGPDVLDLVLAWWTSQSHNCGKAMFK